MLFVIQLFKRNTYIPEEDQEDDFAEVKGMCVSHISSSKALKLITGFFSAFSSEYVEDLCFLCLH